MTEHEDRSPISGWLVDRWLALTGDRRARWFDYALYNWWARREQRRVEKANPPPASDDAA